MRFRVLGPLRVAGGTGEVVLGGRRQQTILAVLLANSGQIVPLEYLVEAVWDHSPPATAKRQIQNRLATLRRVLATTGARKPVIVTDGPGYRIEPDDSDLDARVFADRMVRGKELAGRGQPEAAVDELRSALELWRGPALFGLTGRVVAATAARLEDQRLIALEVCIDLELGLGRHSDVVGELTELVAAYPMRERLVGQLMIALYRSGRQAEAQQAYHRLRTTLVDELGVDPSQAVQRTHVAILASGSPTGAQPAAPAAVDSCHLPRGVPDFVGRSAELASLAAAVPADAGAPTVLTIGGMAGVGKPVPGKVTQIVI